MQIAPTNQHASCASGWVRIPIVAADPPGEMDEKLKSEKIQKEQFSEWGWG